jgi:hypothetical protein
VLAEDFSRKFLAAVVPPSASAFWTGSYAVLTREAVLNREAVLTREIGPCD